MRFVPSPWHTGLALPNRASPTSSLPTVVAARLGRGSQLCDLFRAPSRRPAIVARHDTVHGGGALTPLPAAKESSRTSLSLTRPTAMGLGEVASRTISPTRTITAARLLHVRRASTAVRREPFVPCDDQGVNEPLPLIQEFELFCLLTNLLEPGVAGP